jgi:hypothetical protein
VRGRSEYAKRYTGIKRAAMWWRFFWSHVEEDRYSAAKERVSLEERLQSHKQ